MIKNILICVTKQKSCERLIKKGYEITLKKGGCPFVIHVARIGENFLGNSHEGEALDYLFMICKQIGAQMTVIRSNHVVSALVNYAIKHNIGTIVLGESPDKNQKNSIIKKLAYSLPDVELVVVPA